MALFQRDLSSALAPELVPSLHEKFANRIMGRSVPKVPNHQTGEDGQKNQLNEKCVPSHPASHDDDDNHCRRHD